MQRCAEELLEAVDIAPEELSGNELSWHIAGINHMAWLLEIKDGTTDLYPEIKRRAKEKLAQARKGEAGQYSDLVRLAVMDVFGYYITESSEHNAEYAADILAAFTSNTPARIHGNILNEGHIDNLPNGAVVKVPCLVDANGVQGTATGRLPEQCAALNRTNVNV